MHGRAQALTRTALFAAVISVSAFIRFPLTPVPLTLQSEAVLITGYCLGHLYGPLATLLYTFIGLAGVPIFASGGGPAYVLSPTFGYIIGFTVSAAITGYLARYNRQGSVIRAYCIMLAGLAGIYGPGLLWLGISLTWIAEVPSSMESLMKLGLLIPLAGDLITTIPVAFAAVAIRKRISPTG